MRVLVVASALALAWAPAPSRGDQPILLAPYVPSPESVVTKMLELSSVGPDDYVVDLGSGDGRIPIAAARQFGARGLGVEIDGALVAQSIENAKKAGVSDRVKFVKQDVFATDISRATVVTLYLLSGAIDLLGDKLLNELEPGTRVVSHDYVLKDWIAIRQETMYLPEKAAISGTSKTYVMLFIIPAKVAGRWKGSAPPALGRGALALELSQYAQQLWGKAWLGGAPVEIKSGGVVGEELSFVLEPKPGEKLEFKGRLEGGKLQGTVSGAASGPWSAVKDAK